MTYWSFQKYLKQIDKWSLRLGDAEVWNQSEKTC